MAVLLTSTGANGRLIAFIIANDAPDVATLPDAVLHKLQATLPAYMMPSRIVPLESFPMTPNGKVDKIALSMQLGEIDDNVHCPPEGELENWLINTCAQMLKVDVETLSVMANFFEVGGHSVLSTQLISAINDAFNIQLPIAAIFEAPSFRALAETIQAYQDQQEADFDDEYEDTLELVI